MYMPRKKKTMRRKARRNSSPESNSLKAIHISLPVKTVGRFNALCKASGQNQAEMLEKVLDGAVDAIITERERELEILRAV